MLTDFPPTKHNMWHAICVYTCSIVEVRLHSAMYYYYAVYIHPVCVDHYYILYVLDVPELIVRTLRREFMRVRLRDLCANCAY